MTKPAEGSILWGWQGQNGSEWQSCKPRAHVFNHQYKVFNHQYKAESKLDVGRGFKLSDPTSRDIAPPARPHLLNPTHHQPLTCEPRSQSLWETSLLQTTGHRQLCTL